jgi:hypothetical protein
MSSLAEAFGLGRGCFGREDVLNGTGTFPDRCRTPVVRPSDCLLPAPGSHSQREGLYSRLQGLKRATKVRR